MKKPKIDPDAAEKDEKKNTPPVMSSFAPRKDIENKGQRQAGGTNAGASTSAGTTTTRTWRWLS